MTYSEAIGFLQSLQVFGLRPGLEATLELAARAGSPQNRLRFIHVAGTNGKGSVCALLEGMHRAHGRRVGLYTSPHLVSFGERIQVNRHPMPEAAVAHWVETIRRHLDPAPEPGSGRMPTFFEFVTVMALGYFAEQGCDLVVWETGLGGRLDATNIVQPEASVITNIALDHQAWLGATHDSIATEKAGILKPGRPVITGARPGLGLEVIAAAARRQGCSLTIVDSARDARPAPGPDSSESAAGRAGAGAGERGTTVVDEDAAWKWATQGRGGDWPRLGLAGRHQRSNAGVALATARVLEERWPVSIADMRSGLEHVSWPGRMQVVARPGGSTVLLDGAHNSAGAEALRDGIAELWPGVRPTLILGVLADKDWELMVRILAPLASRILTVPVGTLRTLASETLAGACRAVQPAVPATACRDLLQALALAEADGRGDRHVVIAGSLYLVGEALERLGAAGASAMSERVLNEWKTEARPRRDPEGGRRNCGN